MSDWVSFICVRLHSLRYRQYLSLQFLCFPFLSCHNFFRREVLVTIVTMYFNLRLILQFDLLGIRLSIRRFTWRNRPSTRTSKSRWACTSSLGHTRRSAGFRPGSSSSSPRGSRTGSFSSSSGSCSSSRLRSACTRIRSWRTSPSCLCFIQLNVLTDN